MTALPSALRKHVLLPVKLQGGSEITAKPTFSRPSCLRRSKAPQLQFKLACMILAGTIIIRCLRNFTWSICWFKRLHTAREPLICQTARGSYSVPGVFSRFLTYHAFRHTNVTCTNSMAYQSISKTCTDSIYFRSTICSNMSKIPALKALDRALLKKLNLYSHSAQRYGADLRDLYGRL